MRPKCHPSPPQRSDRSRSCEPRLVCIDTPGYCGTGYLMLPAEPSYRRNPHPRVLEELLLEGAVEVTRAILASERYERGPPPDAALSLTEFEDLEFGAPIDLGREVQCLVRIHARSKSLFRGIFVAHQEAALVAMGKILVKEGLLP